MHRTVYEGVCVCFFALICAVFAVSLRYHDVTAACMYVPVWGRHTNTMNVDIVESFNFFSSKGLRCHTFITWKWTKDKTSMTVVFSVRLTTVNNLFGLILTILDLITDWNKTSVDYLNTWGRDSDDRWEFVKGIWGVASGLGVKKKL